MHWLENITSNWKFWKLLSIKLNFTFILINSDFQRGLLLSNNTLIGKFVTGTFTQLNLEYHAIAYESNTENLFCLKSSTKQVLNLFQ